MAKLRCLQIASNKLFVILLASLYQITTTYTKTWVELGDWLHTETMSHMTLCRAQSWSQSVGDGIDHKPSGRLPLPSAFLCSLLTDAHAVFIDVFLSICKLLFETCLYSLCVMMCSCLCLPVKSADGWTDCTSCTRSLYSLQKCEWPDRHFLRHAIHSWLWQLTLLHTCCELVSVVLSWYRRGGCELVSVVLSWYRCGCEKAACVWRPAAAGSDILHCCCARGFVSCSTTSTCCMSTVLTLALKCEIFFCEFSECVLILMFCLNYTFTQLAFKQLVMGLHCLVLFW